MSSNQKAFKINREIVLKELSIFGLYQKYIYTLASFCSFLGGIMVFSPYLTGQTPNHRCKIPACDSSNSSFLEEFLNFTIPWNNKSGKWDECNAYVTVNPSYTLSCSSKNFYSNHTSGCTDWIFEEGIFSNTPITQFNLVCERSWMVSLDSSSIMWGMLFGSIVMGFVSDIYGRKAALFGSVVIFILGSNFTVIAPSYEVLILMRIMSGMGGIGCFDSSFITAIEGMGANQRTKLGILLNAPFSLGMSFFLFISYLVRDWRSLSILAASPALLIGFNYWVVPESIYWLLSKNKDAKVYEIMKRVAAFNKRPMPEEMTESISQEKYTQISRGTLINKSIFDLFRTQEIRRKTLILYYCWSVNAIAYYGLVMYETKISDNNFISIAVKFLIDIPAYVASAFLIDRLGRKWWHILTLLSSGVACVTISCIIFAALSDAAPIISYLNLLAKFGSAATYSSLYLYTGEIFPTEYRGLGVGSCSMMSRAGALVAPFVANFTGTFRILPPLIIGVGCLIGGSLVFLLPETYGKELPQTLNKEKEQISKFPSIVENGCTSKPLEVHV